ncbi:MAG: serine hydrolase [Sulfurimonas sp.]|jgi:D-alanyl-D-alanine carboxypeptidase (penicillin-binding protein 5/6)|nr:serine hydrolase [Sulfurimonadaceae bacterium]
MKYFVIFGIFLVSFLSADSAIFKKIEKDLDSFIVKDLSQDAMLFSKNEDKLIRPASLTKIMTSIIAIESGKMDDVVTITKPMIEVEPTKINLVVGEKIKLRDLVHAAMIKSANDAAYAIAYYLGDGNKQIFLDIMNTRAKELGMLNTHYADPAGFDSKTHRSSAKDLLTLTEYVIKNKTFNSIVNLKSYSFYTQDSGKKYTVATSNKLMKEHKYIVGVKTGYTNAAGPCLIARAKKDGKDILLVMLNAGNRWANAQKALDEAMGESVPSSELLAKN